MHLAVGHLYGQQKIKCCNELYFPYYLWQSIFTGNFKTCLVGHHLAPVSAEVKQNTAFLLIAVKILSRR